jgi:hypothetical protein
MTDAAVDDAVAERGKTPVAEPFFGPGQYRREHLASGRSAAARPDPAV